MDVGSGSGWTTAILAEIVADKGKVFAIEIVPELKEFGEKNVAKYGFIEKGIVEFILGDGSEGYKKEAPYDRILVSATALNTPDNLKQQLKVGGILVLPADDFRDFTTVWQKNLNFYWADGDSVFNTEAEAGGVTEDPEDSGHMAINYGTEPAWFRFGVPPCNEGACETIVDANRYYANELVGGDPETPVFTAKAGKPFRMHVLMPASTGRKSVPTLHGHLWQRDPYVCPAPHHLGLDGKCTTDEVGSQALGENPVGFYIGAFQSLMATGHFEIVAPRAGGAYDVPGDYLFRDHMGLGNLDGLWGIVRVAQPEE